MICMERLALVNWPLALTTNLDLAMSNNTVVMTRGDKTCISRIGYCWEFIFFGSLVFFFRRSWVVAFGTLFLGLLLDFCMFVMLGFGSHVKYGGAMLIFVHLVYSAMMANAVNEWDLCERLAKGWSPKWKDEFHKPYIEGKLGYTVESKFVPSVLES